jgi:hypothetical protein
MIKYQVEEDFLCGGWQNVESDGDGNKIYYDTAEEAQASISDFVEEWNEEVDNGTNELGDHYDVDNYRVVKVNIDERLDVLQKIKELCITNRRIDWTDIDPSYQFKIIQSLIENPNLEYYEENGEIAEIEAEKQSPVSREDCNNKQEIL